MAEGSFQGTMMPAATFGYPPVINQEEFLDDQPQPYFHQQNNGPMPLSDYQPYTDDLQLPYPDQQNDGQMPFATYQPCAGNFQPQPVQPVQHVQGTGLLHNIDLEYSWYIVAAPSRTITYTWFSPAPKLELYDDATLTSISDRLAEHSHCLWNLAHADFGFCLAQRMGYQDPNAPEASNEVNAHLAARCRQFLDGDDAPWAGNFIKEYDVSDKLVKRIRDSFAGVTNTAQMYDALHSLCYEVLKYKYLPLNNDDCDWSFQMSCHMEADLWYIRILSQWKEDVKKNIQQRPMSQ